MEKQQLRQVGLDKRNTLPDKEGLSKLISKTAIDLIVTYGNTSISCYYPTKGEVNTIPIIEYCLVKNLVIYIPHVFPDNSMSMLKLHDQSELEESTYGLMQLKQDIIYSEDRSLGSDLIDIVFTPLLAFDSRKFRLGYGKGFYDLYFSSLSRKVNKVGLAFSTQEIPALPNEEHDIQLDQIITEHGLF